MSDLVDQHESVRGNGLKSDQSSPEKIKEYLKQEETSGEGSKRQDYDGLSQSKSQVQSDYEAM